MKKMNIIGLLGSVITIIAAWLPWAKVEMMGETTSVNGFLGEMGGNPGIIFVALGVLCAVFFLVNKKWSNIVSLIFALCIIGDAIRQMSSLKGLGEGVSTGIGLYLGIVGGALILVGAFMGMKGTPAAPSNPAA